MYLHIGNDIVVNINHIVGIFDMDNTTVSRLGREFLPKAQNDGIIINATEDLPKSYVLTKHGKEARVYISSVSSQVLSKRLKTAKITIANE
ncbi:MAG: extracellular matrix regulator RemB [Clostridia bacterium]